MCSTGFVRLHGQLKAWTSGFDNEMDFKVAASLFMGCPNCHLSTPEKAKFSQKLLIRVLDVPRQMALSAAAEI